MATKSRTRVGGTARKILDFALAGTKHALTGSRQYYAWLAALSLVILIGGYTFVQKLDHGLIITSARWVNPWGTLIYSQFPFFVGVADGAVMLIVPAHLYHREDFEDVVMIGQALAVAAVVVSIGCVLVMLGKLSRLIYIMPVVGSPNFPQSMLPWDVIVLNAYLVLIMVITGYGLYKIYHRETLPTWRRYLIYISIPLGIVVHAVTAFIIVANPVRNLWYTALMIPRFLTSAFVAGPALIILALLAIRRANRGTVYQGFKIEDRTLYTLGHIILIALLTNFFSIISEIFTLGWPQTSHWHTMEYLLFGLEHGGHTYNMLTPLMWLAMVGEVIAILLLLHPRTRKNLKTLSFASALAFIAIYFEKGIILFIAVFVVSPLGEVYEPNFTVPELVLVATLWAVGALVFTLLAKAAIGLEARGAGDGH